METLNAVWIDLNTIAETQYPHLAQILPAARRAHACRYRQDADRQRSLAAGALLQYALDQAGVPRSNRTLAFIGNGKPILAPDTGFHFSLSHSGPVALCAYGPAPLGADVEKPDRPALRVVQRKCPPGEWAWLQAQPDPEAAFFRLWVLKEAYVKALGTGLALGLDRYEICFGTQVTVLRSGRVEPWTFHEAVLAGCPAALCSAAAFPCCWHQVSADELLSSQRH